MKKLRYVYIILIVFGLISLILFPSVISGLCFTINCLVFVNSEFMNGLVDIIETQKEYIKYQQTEIEELKDKFFKSYEKNQTK